MGSGAKSSELLYQSVSNISKSSGFCHTQCNMSTDCDDLVECGNLDAFGYVMCSGTKTVEIKIRTKNSRKY